MGGNYTDRAISFGRVTRLYVSIHQSHFAETAPPSFIRSGLLIMFLLDCNAIVSERLSKVEDEAACPQRAQCSRADSDRSTLVLQDFPGTLRNSTTRWYSTPPHFSRPAFRLVSCQASIDRGLAAPFRISGLVSSFAIWKMMGYLSQIAGHAEHTSRRHT